jgi:hypothetical protein
VGQTLTAGENINQVQHLTVVEQLDQPCKINDVKFQSCPSVSKKYCTSPLLTNGSLDDRIDDAIASYHK